MPIQHGYPSRTILHGRERPRPHLKGRPNRCRRLDHLNIAFGGLCPFAPHPVPEKGAWHSTTTGNAAQERSISMCVLRMPHPAVPTRHNGWEEWGHFIHSCLVVPLKFASAALIGLRTLAFFNSHRRGNWHWGFRGFCVV